MNTAPAIDLESLAGLLRKEAAALIAYRAKHGPCKTLQDLKKIPDVYFLKIERRNARGYRAASCRPIHGTTAWSSAGWAPVNRWSAPSMVMSSGRPPASALAST